MLTLREEILNLLESPELLEYLLSNPERLCEFDYANIIAGAPIGLAEKRALLEKLKSSAELRREPDKVADYIAALNSATAALENSGNETVLSVVLRRCGVDSFVDGAYYAASAESARRAIREYVSECSDCDWGHMYWEMKLYRRSDASESGGFMRTEYIYIAEPNGEIQYFLHNYGRRGKTKYYTRAEETFGESSAELRREPDKVADYIAALNSATAALENSGNETVLSVVLRRCGVDSFVDGAYYAASAESARRAIREYVSECSDCDWGHMYWEMKLYRRSDASESGGFMRTEYIYIAEPNGEIQYFLHNYGRRGKTKYYTRAEETFGERSADLNLPVPYRPGDILKIDCSPYTDGVHYCILTEVGDDCCGVRCMYPVFDGRIGHGALKHGNYISESACGIKQYLSPLYRARICVEELPESCRFMKSLRVKLRSDPDFGKAISQVGSYLKFRQS